MEAFVFSLMIYQLVLQTQWNYACMPSDPQKYQSAHQDLRHGTFLTYAQLHDAERSAERIGNQHYPKRIIMLELQFFSGEKGG